MSNISTDQMLVTESDLEAAMDKIETIPFHEEKEVGAIKFWCYNAGHAGVKILHDYELCNCPNEREDILVILIPKDVEVCGKIFYTRSTRTSGST